MGEPKKKEGFRAKWKRFNMRMSNAFGIALFALMYVIVFAPIALVFKLTGTKFLPHFKGDEPTYFLPKEKIEPTLEWMQKQG